MTPGLTELTLTPRDATYKPGNILTQYCTNCEGKCRDHFEGALACKALKMNKKELDWTELGLWQQVPKATGWDADASTNKRILYLKSNTSSHLVHRSFGHLVRQGSRISSETCYTGDIDDASSVLQEKRQTQLKMIIIQSLSHLPLQWHHTWLSLTADLRLMFMHRSMLEEETCSKLSRERTPALFTRTSRPAKCFLVSSIIFSICDSSPRSHLWNSKKNNYVKIIFNLYLTMTWAPAPNVEHSSEILFNASTFLPTRTNLEFNITVEGNFFYLWFTLTSAMQSISQLLCLCLSWLLWSIWSCSEGLGK